MYTVSDEFKNIVKSNAVTAVARITLATSNTVIDGNQLVSVSIKDYCYNNGNIIGTTMCKEAEIEIINNNYDLADKEFKLEVGVMLPNGTFEYIPYGNYIVKSYTDMKSNNKYKIVAYDYMDKLNKTFVDNNTYPMTLQSFYEEFATQYGVETVVQELPNQSFNITQKPYFEGMSGRIVLSAIAQMFGSFAKFNRDNMLQMYLRNETSETISREQMNSKLEIDKKYGPINVVTLSLKDVEDENVTLKDDKSIAAPAGKNIFSYNAMEWQTATYTYTELDQGKKYTLSMKLKEGITIPSGLYVGFTKYGKYAEVQRLRWIIANGYYSVPSIDDKTRGINNVVDGDMLNYLSVYPASYASQLENLFDIQIEEGDYTKYEPFEPNGETTLNIQDNPFVYTQALREQAIQGIYDRVIGFSYIPTSFNYKSYMYLDCGDAIQVQNMKTDDYIDTIILNQDIKVPRTRQSKCSNLALTNTEVKNKYTPKEEQAQRRTEIIVDKQNNQITQIIEKTDSNTQQINSTISDLNGVKTRVGSTETKIVEVENSIDATNTNVSNLNTKVDDAVSNLQAQIDGSILFWNGEEIPTLNNYPANEWTTEEMRNNHRADIYTVIEDIEGELKQGKSYRFDKVGTTWTWVELTDNELSAVQALAASKAKVFVTTPKVPYNVGDLWLRNKELYECQTAKDASGAYSETDWVKATKYTDDTAAALAQMTADQAVQNTTLTATTEEAKEFHIENSADSYCKSAEIYGESTQKTRSGKNLIHLNATKTSNGITVTNNGDGTITINGTAEVAMDFWIANGTYYLDSAYKHSFVTGDKLTQSRNIISGTSSGTWKLRTILYNPATSQAHWGTLADDMTFIANFDGDTRAIELIIPVGATFTNLKMFPQLEVGEVATEPEMYGQMPSSEFESPIESVSGKNLFDFEYAKNYANTIQNTYRFIKVEGIKANTTYTFSNYDEDAVKNSTFETIAITYEANYAGVNNAYGFIRHASNNPNARGPITITTKSTTDLYIGVYKGNSWTEELWAEFISYFKDLLIEESAIPTFYVLPNHIGFKSIGKNIFNKSQSYRSSNIGKSYWTITELETGVQVSNTYTSGGSPYVRYILSDLSDYIGKTIRAKMKFESSGENTGRYRLCVCDAYGGNGLQKTVSDNSDATISFTLGELTSTQKYLALDLYSNGSGTQTSGAYVNYTDIMVTIANEDMSYEQYKESITAIPLLHDMRSLSNGTRDRKYWQNGKWYDEQCIARLLLDGVNVKFAQKSGSTANVIWMTNTDYDVPNGTPLLCSHGELIDSAIAYDNDTYGAYFDNKRFKLAFGANTAINTLELANEWLIDNNVEVIYELAEPIVTEITDTAMIQALEHIRTFAGITNITSDASAKLTYYTNTVLNDEYETKLNANKQYTQTIEKFAEQEITNDGIRERVSATETKIGNNYTEIMEKFDGYAPTSEITRIESSVETLQTNTYTKTEINTKLTDGSVTKLKSTVLTADDEGLTVDKSDSKTKSNMDADGFEIIDKTGSQDKSLLKAKYDEEKGETIVEADNMTVNRYFQCGSNSRFEDFQRADGKIGTAPFFTGG